MLYQFKLVRNPIDDVVITNGKVQRPTLTEIEWKKQPLVKRASLRN